METGRQNYLARWGRLMGVLALALLVGLATDAGGALAAELPETARPLAGRESTPLCSPECELVTAPTEAASGREYEGSGPGGGFSPQELREAYGLPATGGAGITVAVVDDLGDPQAESDLATYRAQFGLPVCTEADGCFHQVNELGVAHRPTVNGSWLGEITLDLDMVSAGCPECNILLVEGSGRAGRIEAIKSAVELGADVVTNSWNMGFEEGNPANGEACDYSLCVTEAEERRYDSELSFPGVPIIFSGGDYGYAVRYPADSPNVISVGGTRLRHQAEGARAWSEEAWANSAYEQDEKGRGTGGGCSLFEPKPAWQTDTACARRIENDVSADADPRSPVASYSTTNGWRAVGGTSASAPFIAGVEGLSTATARRQGAEAIWQLGAAGDLFDVTAGSVGTCTPPAADAYWCSAGTGFDAPTGWGTPDGPFAPVGVPQATTEPATGIALRGATLHGTVDDDGVAGGTTCSFQVAASGDPSFTAPLQTVPCTPPTVGTRAAVSTTVTRLSPHTTYLVRVLATNAAGGPVSGGTQTFATLPEAPELSEAPAGTVTRTAAELRAEVDNKGATAGTSCAFELAHDGDYKFEAPFKTVPCEPDPVRGEGLVPVVATASGLSVNTTYLWRLTATNAGGSTDWIAGEFTTLPEPPTAVTGTATAHPTAAFLKAQVDDEGDASGSSCAFQITRTTDPRFEAPLAIVPCEPATVTGGAPVGVEAEATGLTPSTQYLYRVTASNRGGSSNGANRSFTTEAEPPPVVVPPTGYPPPTIVKGPPDETEIREAKEAQEAAEAAVRRAAAGSPAPATPLSNQFALGRPTRHGAVLLVPVTLPGPGTVTIADGQAVVRATDAAIAGGAITVRVRLSRATVRRAAAGPKLRLRLVVDYTPSGGAEATKTLSVAVGVRSRGR